MPDRMACPLGQYTHGRPTGSTALAERAAGLSLPALRALASAKRLDLRAMTRAERAARLAGDLRALGWRTPCRRDLGRQVRELAVLLGRRERAAVPGRTGVGR